jgi:hypothetical protein
MFEEIGIVVGDGITWLQNLSDGICLNYVVNKGNNNAEWTNTHAESFFTQGENFMGCPNTSKSHCFFHLVQLLHLGACSLHCESINNHSISKNKG